MKNKLALILFLVIAACACFAGCGDGRTAADIEGEYVLSEISIEKEDVTDRQVYSVDEIDSVEDETVKACLYELVEIYSEYKFSIKCEDEKNGVKIESYEQTADKKWATVFAQTSTVYFREEAPTTYYMDVPDAALDSFLGNYYNTVGVIVIGSSSGKYKLTVSPSNGIGISPVQRIYDIKYNYHYVSATYQKIEAEA